MNTNPNIGKFQLITKVGLTENFRFVSCTKSWTCSLSTHHTSVSSIVQCKQNFLFIFSFVEKNMLFELHGIYNNERVIDLMLYKFFKFLLRTTFSDVIKIRSGKKSHFELTYCFIRGIFVGRMFVLRKGAGTLILIYRFKDIGNLFNFSLGHMYLSINFF